MTADSLTFGIPSKIPLSKLANGTIPDAPLVWNGSSWVNELLPIDGIGNPGGGSPFLGPLIYDIVGGIPGWYIEGLNVQYLSPALPGGGTAAANTVVQYTGTHFDIQKVPPSAFQAGGATNFSTFWWDSVGLVWNVGKLPWSGLTDGITNKTVLVWDTGQWVEEKLDLQTMASGSTTNAPIWWNGSAWTNAKLPIIGIANGTTPTAPLWWNNALSSWVNSLLPLGGIDGGAATTNCPIWWNGIGWQSSKLQWNGLIDGSVTNAPLYWTGSAWINSQLPLTGLSPSGTIGQYVRSTGSSWAAHNLIPQDLDTTAGSPVVGQAVVIPPSFIATWSYPDTIADQNGGSTGTIGIGDDGAMFSTAGRLPTISAVNVNLTSATIVAGSSPSFLIVQVIVGATAPAAATNLFTLTYNHAFNNRPVITYSLNRWGTDSGLGTLLTNGPPVFIAQSVNVGSFVTTCGIALVAGTTFHIGIHVVGS